MGLTTSNIGCRYIIIGTSAAGIAAAESIRDQGQGKNLTLIGEEAHGFYSRPGLAYYLTGEVSEQQFSLRQASSFKRIRGRAVAVDPEAHRVALADGRTLDYDRLLIPGGTAVQRDVAFSRTRILVGPGRITGAVVMGDQTLSRSLHALIAGLADITPILESLLDPHAPVADIIVGFWRRWSCAHAA